MKKLLLSLLLILGAGFCLNTFGQIQSGTPQFQGPPRTVYFYIYGLETQDQAEGIEEFLVNYTDRIYTVNIDLATQMCVMSVNKIENLDIQELVLSQGFKAVLCQTLPPAGQRYVFNPDGTWKIKNL